MTNQIARRLPAAMLAGAFLLGIAAPARAIVFSLDPTSPSGAPADIYEGFGGFLLEPPVVTATQLGLQATDNITGIHRGAMSAFNWWFSVDRSSVGLAGTAVSASASGQHAGADIFAAGDLGNVPAGDNVLAVSHQQMGLVANDNIDGMFFFVWRPEVPVYFTLGPGSPSLAALGASPGDILLHAPDGSNSVFRTAVELGLEPGDVIDAFELSVSSLGWDAILSLAPLSPTLLETSALFPQGHSAADIFAVNSNQTLYVMSEAWQLGLAFADNIDALGGTFDCSWNVLADCDVPEPRAALLMAVGLAAYGGGASRRRRRGANED